MQNGNEIIRARAVSPCSSTSNTFSTPEGPSARTREEFCELQLLSVNANKHTVFVAVLTFAILFHLSVVLDEGRHLGENYQKLAIPAGNIKVTEKKRPAMTAGHLHDGWVLKSR